jgi:hypothetical protein
VTFAIDQADAVAHTCAQNAHQVLGLIRIQGMNWVNNGRIKQSHGPKVFVAVET